MDNDLHYVVYMLWGQVKTHWWIVTYIICVIQVTGPSKDPMVDSDLHYIVYMLRGQVKIHWWIVTYIMCHPGYGAK